MLSIFSLLLSKNSLYIIIGIAVFSGIGSLYYTQHYLPIKNLKKDVQEVQKQNKELQRQLRVVGNSLNTCEANLTAQTLNGFIEGIGETNEVIISDLNNLHT